MAKENKEIAFLHANYGQRTEKRELQAFHDIKDYLRQHNLIKIGSNAPDYILRSIYENAFL